MVISFASVCWSMRHSSRRLTKLQLRSAESNAVSKPALKFHSNQHSHSNANSSNNSSNQKTRKKASTRMLERGSRNLRGDNVRYASACRDWNWCHHSCIQKSQQAKEPLAKLSFSPCFS